MFQKRMGVSGGVGVEFIARGACATTSFDAFTIILEGVARLWALRFTAAMSSDVWCGSSSVRPGPWLVTLALLERSPPTWVDLRLIICEKERDKSKPEIRQDFVYSIRSRLELWLSSQCII